MRIAFVDRKLNVATGGGSNLSLDRAARGLAELGHDVSVITLSPSPNSVTVATPYRVVEESEPTAQPAVAERLALVRILRRHEKGVDLFGIHAPSLIPGAATYRALGGSVPVVARLTDYGLFCTYSPRMDGICYERCGLLEKLLHKREPSLRRLLLAPLRIAEHTHSRLLVNRVDRFIAISPAVAEVHCRYGIDPGKIVVIPPVVAYAALLAEPRRAAALGRDDEAPFKLLYVGRLRGQKGVDVLITALAQLDFPATLDVLGDGEERQSLEQLAHRLGVSSRVNFQGWVPQVELANWYLAAHAFVHPGRWPEPFGLTIVEAMAAGTPTIVSDVGGPPWTVGEAGLTFRPGDSADLVRRIRQLRENPELAKRLSRRGRKRVLDFDPTKVLPRLESLYRSLVR